VLAALQALIDVGAKPAGMLARARDALQVEQGTPPPWQR